VNTLLAWTSIRTTSSRVPNLDTDAGIGDRLLEVGIWVTDADHPWKFRGAVNHVLEPWPSLELVKVRCDEEAIVQNEALGVFQLMEMNVMQDAETIQHEVIDLLGRYGDPGEFILAGRGVAIIERPMIAEWLPEVSSWFNPDLVLDVSGISYAMAMAGLSEELEPHYEPSGTRAMHAAQLSFLEFEHYTRVLQTVPLVEPSDTPEE